MSRHRLPISLAAAALAAALVAPLAHAEPAPPPRLSGTFTVTFKVTRSNNAEPVGTTFVKPFKFTPTCAKGGCATNLTRTRGDDITITYLLKTTAAGTYTGNKTYKGSCFLKSGGQVRNAYTYTEATSVKPTKVVRGSVVTFTGTMRLSFKPTPVGVANDCWPGNAVYSLSGKR